MKRFLTACAVGLITMAAISASAQVRNTSVKIDDGSGHFLIIQAPTGMTGPLTWTAPIPPAGNPPSGFINTGSASGQLPYWDNTGTGQWSHTTNLVWDEAAKTLAVGGTTTTFNGTVYNLGVTGTAGVMSDQALIHDAGQIKIFGATDQHMQLELGYYTGTVGAFPGGHGSI